MEGDTGKYKGRGGKRTGAGSKPRWRLGRTQTIRVPIAIASEITDLLKAIDAGALSEKDAIAIIEELRSVINQTFKGDSFMTNLTPEQAHNQLSRMESVIDAYVMADYVGVEQLHQHYEVKLPPSLAEFYQLNRVGDAYEIIDSNEASPDEPFQIFDRRSEKENYSAAIAWMKAQRRSK